MTYQNPSALSRLAWLMLLIGLLLTGLSAWQVKTTSDNHAIKEFAFVAQKITTTITERLNAYALVLRGAAGLLNAADTVTRQEWETYVSQLQLMKNKAGISGINFAEYVPANQLASHTARIQSEGFPHYHIWPSYPRAAYSSLIYLSPFDARNQKALGYDMFSEPTRRQAMSQARDSGEVSLSAKIALIIEDTESPQAGTVMYAPVYRPNSDLTTLALRRAALLGWAVGGYRMDDLMESLLSQWQAPQEKAITMEVFDGQASPEHLLYQSHPLAKPHTSSMFSQQQTVNFNGRIWLLHFDYLNPQHVVSYQYVWATLLGGSILSILLFLLIQSFARTRASARALAQALTEQVYQREQQLKVALHRLKTIASRIPGMVFEYNYSGEGQGHFPFTSEGIQRIYGISPQQVQEDANQLFAMVHPEDIAAVINSIKESAIYLTPWRHEYRIYHPDGKISWLYGDSEPHKEANGSITWYGLVTDITERKEAELALKAANQQTLLFRQALDHVPSCIFMKDINMRYTYANRATLELLGCNSAMLLGSTGEEFLGPETTAQLNLIDKKTLQGEPHQLEFSLTGPNGHVTHFLDVKTPIFDEADHSQVIGMLGIATDITLLKANEQKLEYQAHYDTLTKLPNRLMLADRLHQAMLQASRHQQSIAIIYLDLDGFKYINDNYGHDAGDELLRAVAARMKNAIRDGDTLARLGGDEFVVILLDIEQLSDSFPLLKRLLDAASRPVLLNHHRLQVTASLGVTFYPQPEVLEPEQLIRQADQAMYQAKLAGKNRYYLFDSEQARNMREHHQSVEHINRALLAKEFTLYYQPKVNMRTGAIIGVEALIRWQHPEQGLLSPNRFLPFIEEHRLAVEVGDWVIDSALQQILNWQQQNIALGISINIAARHLRQVDFAAKLAAHLANYPSIAPNMLELEVLETSALGDLALVSKTLETCRDLGVGISLDDFGTGYSSLTYLKRLPTHTIKVDQSFIRDILEDPEDLAILDGVLSLAKAFGRQVIAEGVETLAHGDTLLRMGCHLAQGYGIARPMPATEVPTWLANWQPPARWLETRQLHRDEFSLLYAGLQHKAWIDDLVLAVQHNSETWPLFDSNQSHLSQWLNSQPNISATRLNYQTALSQKIKQCVAELAKYYANHGAKDANSQLISQLDALCELKAQLIKELEECMNDSKR
ncbi:EAL domain-containing protein [Oceanisphaera avium]|uniref:Diguanylate cyclase n=1 Tax=Oceanisphaera avium TaxID=1903694 RepID=A0A1Y0CXK0_9GAMM|nr:EAL domain-containing protein [Oceanisphaera avium]ART80032.1 hypothetical protein CBP12_07630 [Oceanisphaera avium]